MPYARFMSSGAGRILRVLVGLVLLYVGLTMVHGVVGLLIAVVALLPITAGTLDFCLLGPALGAPFWGHDLHPEG
jgi:Inner membrane protein YgaP-like, transmembrane domain